MRNVAIVFDTKKGQTEKIALFMQKTLEDLGCVVEVHNLHRERPSLGSQIDGVVVGGPVYAGRFQRSLKNWVTQNRDRLKEKRTGFFVVALNTADKHEKARADDERLLREFITWLGMTPQYVANVAGALKYTKYFFLIRWQLKKIAAGAGGDTDTSKDYEYTNWASVRAFCEDFAAGKTASPFATASRFPSMMATAEDRSTL